MEICFWPPTDAYSETQSIQRKNERKEKKKTDVILQIKQPQSLIKQPKKVQMACLLKQYKSFVQGTDLNFPKQVCQYAEWRFSINNYQNLSLFITNGYNMT